MVGVAQGFATGPRRHGLCAGRRPRQPPHGTDRQARQARGLFRRQVPHHRLRAVQCAEFRHPPHRRRHPVQGAQPDPPPAARLELLPPRAQRELRHPARRQRVSEDQWYAGTADAVYQNLDIIESYGPQLHGDPGRRPHLQDGLRADAAAARRLGRRRHRRLPRGAAHGGDRLRRHACRRRRTASSPSSRSRRIRRAFPASPTWRWPRWASMSSRPKFLSDQLRRDAADPNSSRDFGKDIIPYIVKHGKAVAHRFTRLLRALRHTRRRPTGATSAPSMPIGRPISTSPTSSRRSTSTTTNWPIWTYAEVTPPAKFVHDEDGRRGTAVASLVSGGCIVSGASLKPHAALHRRAGQFLLARSRRRWCCPMSISAATRGSSKVVIDRGVDIPEGLVVGEDPELDAKRFRRTDERHLPHHPADDRPPGSRDDRSSRSPPKSIPLIKTGGLADVVGRAARGPGRRTASPCAASCPAIRR